MKKIIVAGVCGLALIASCAFFGSNNAEPKMASSGLLIHVTV